MNPDEAGVFKTVLPGECGGFVQPLVLLRHGDLVGCHRELQDCIRAVRHFRQQLTHGVPRGWLAFEGQLAGFRHQADERTPRRWRRGTAGRGRL